MPIGDWQFWVVTVVAVVAVGAVGRKVLMMLRPLWKKQRGDVRRASLTISAKSDRSSGDASRSR